MPLSEHVYCVAVGFQLTEYSNKPASDFALSLNIPLWKLFGWFRRLQLWATVDCQLHHENAPAHTSRLMQSFLVKHQITQVTQPCHSPDFMPCELWLFLKLKSPLKGKRFQTILRVKKITTGQLMVIGRIMWGHKVPILKGTEVSLSYIQCFLYLVSSINISIFILHGWTPSGQYFIYIFFSHCQFLFSNLFTRVIF